MPMRAAYKSSGRRRRPLIFRGKGKEGDIPIIAEISNIYMDVLLFKAILFRGYGDTSGVFE